MSFLAILRDDFVHEERSNAFLSSPAALEFRFSPIFADESGNLRQNILKFLPAAPLRGVVPPPSRTPPRIVRRPKRGGCTSSRCTSSWREVGGEGDKGERLGAWKSCFRSDENGLTCWIVSYAPALASALDRAGGSHA